MSYLSKISLTPESGGEEIMHWYLLVEESFNKNFILELIFLMLHN